MLDFYIPFTNAFNNENRLHYGVLEMGSELLFLAAYDADTRTKEADVTSCIALRRCFSG